MIIHTMSQRSDEWFAIKCGKFSGTDFGKLMPTPKQSMDDFNDTQMAIIYRVAAERFTGLKKGSDWGSIPKDHGIEFEDEARVSYMLETGYNVHEVGFVELDEWTGCSPDGLIDNPKGEAWDGGLEIKCLNSDTHLRYLRNPDELKAAYYWQCMVGMFCTGRRWWDLYSYDPRFEREDMRSVKIRIEWDDMEMVKMAARLGRARAKVAAML